ncbi:hypothetical protein HY464_01110 [Candidatus Peregrinibacteria bacterium]|nr:hypothetical protein [Candidatus Peregrinibacteria bacterium]MBI4129273.1 hypothetical protein [Candidatus Peregrinibacteria bacterium]
MRKLVPTLLILSIVLLAGCSSNRPLTEEEQAADYGITVEKFREEKKAAARMNMGMGKHKSMIKKDE